ncbi:MAG: hypothetical protein KDD76_04990, partial [Rickettsiales bacterium]|nr:hypothetical protein [Rickettsiales bacterium]
MKQPFIIPHQHTVLASVPEGSEALVLARMAQEHPHGILHIARDDARLALLAQALAWFAPHIRTLTFPAWDCIPYDRISPNISVVSERMRTLSALTTPITSPSIVLTTVNAVIQRVIPRNLMAEKGKLLQRGTSIPHEELTHFLVHNGYVRVGMANEPGEFAVRGSIVDICPAGEEDGYRLDFFGDELDSIRCYDALTQISSEKVETLHLVPASEILLNEDTVTRFRKRYRELFGTAHGDPLYEAVSEERKYAGVEHWLPLFYEHPDTLFDYLPKAAITLDPLADSAYHERDALIRDSYDTRRHAPESDRSLTYHPLPPEQLYLPEAEWQQVLSRGTSTFDPSPADTADKRHLVDLAYMSGQDFRAESTAAQTTAWELLKDALVPEVIKGKGKQKLKTVIACMSEGTKSRMAKFLEEYAIPHMEAEDAEQATKRLNQQGTVALSVLPLPHGFRAEGWQIVSEQDVLGERILRSSRSKKHTNPEHFLNEASHLEAGEIVVHREHGIGRFEGLETLTVAGTSHDCLKLVYAEGDRLYLPVENIDLISKYGSDSDEVVLDKLGGVAWQKRTAALKNRIKLAAEELLGIAAKRATRTAEIFTPESHSYDAFCARFPYQETEDQQRAIDDVLNDLSTGRPMDRLVCGDVGFGKTEVALRAAFVV